MKIVIATGIYPPEIGGPAEYARNLADVWRKDGNMVEVRVFSRFNFLPTGLRHLIYLFYILPSFVKADFIITMDTFSAALPAVLASKIFGKKIILRTGGDFLWESYVERTGDLVLMRDFYNKKIPRLSFKEKLVFKIIGFVLRNANAIVWTTEWQKNIFMFPYKLDLQKHFIVEHYYGNKLPSVKPKEKNFVASTRALKWKNLEVLKEIFDRKEVVSAGATLDMKPLPHQEFLDKISKSYAIIIVSLGDISPNTILDAIRCNKPFILTKETGLTLRIKDIAVFADPQNPDDIEKKVLWLCNSANYEEQIRKVESFNFSHSWEEIAEEYVEIYKNLK